MWPEATWGVQGCSILEEKGALFANCLGPSKLNVKSKMGAILSRALGAESRRLRMRLWNVLTA